jgi:hypothetical protein
MGVKLVSASGGSVEINPPATASSFTATMPAGTGNVVVAGINSAITAATAQASTSGTSIDFTGIPSWVKRITVMLDIVSTNGTSAIQLQLGDSGGVETSGYASTVSSVSNSAYGSNVLTSGVPVNNGSAAAASYSGVLTCVKLNGNLWATSISCIRTDVAVAFFGGGNKTLSDTLDRVRITTVNGTDTFDAGSINILYE